MDYSVFKGRVSIVCVGNELSGDDALGYAVWEGIKDIQGAQVIFASTFPENFTDEIIDYAPEKVMLVDGADFKGTGGEIRVLDERSIQSVSFSTHRAPLKIFTGRLRQEGIETVLVGVQIEATGLGEPMSASVKKAAEYIVEGITSARS